MPALRPSTIRALPDTSLQALCTELGDDDRETQLLAAAELEARACVQKLCAAVGDGSRSLASALRAAYDTGKRSAAEP